MSLATALAAYLHICGTPWIGNEYGPDRVPICDMAGNCRLTINGGRKASDQTHVLFASDTKRTCASVN
jgi:hypothetical protein